MESEVSSACMQDLSAGRPMASDYVRELLFDTQHRHAALWNIDHPDPHKVLGLPQTA